MILAPPVNAYRAQHAIENIEKAERVITSVITALEVKRVLLRAEFNSALSRQESAQALTMFQPRKRSGICYGDRSA